MLSVNEIKPVMRSDVAPGARFVSVPYDLGRHTKAHLGTATALAQNRHRTGLMNRLMGVQVARALPRHVLFVHLLLTTTFTPCDLLSVHKMRDKILSLQSEAHIC